METSAIYGRKCNSEFTKSISGFNKIMMRLLFAILVIVITNSVHAQSTYSVKVVKATIKGSSSLHDWESQITKIECKGSFQSNENSLKAIKNVEVKIAVDGIKSKEGKVMDTKTFEAFKYDKNPFIIYSFSNAQVKTDAMKVVTVQAYGNLTMAGNTKTVNVSATGKVLANGDIQLSGSQKLKMTDFKMKPPSMVLGTIKVGNEVTIVFDLLLIKSKQQPKQSSLKL